MSVARNAVTPPTRIRNGRRGDYGVGAYSIVRFTVWAMKLRRTPTTAQIVAHCDVHRATAYRWLRLFKDATGQP